MRLRSRHCLPCWPSRPWRSAVAREAVRAATRLQAVSQDMQAGSAVMLAAALLPRISAAFNRTVQAPLRVSVALLHAMETSHRATAAMRREAMLRAALWDPAEMAMRPVSAPE